jgi:hypothetical protein
MGLDIRIKKTRLKHVNVPMLLDIETEPNTYLEHLYNSDFAKPVAEFRNIWEWKERYNCFIPEYYNKRGQYFTILSCYDEIANIQDVGFESDRLREVVSKFDFNKFIYIVEFDF